LILSFTIQSQVTQEWVQRYNGTANSFDIVTKLQIDQNSNVYVYGTTNETGHATDLVIIKYSSNGSILWSYKYNGNSSSFDQLNDAVLDSNGNSYITGTVTENDTQYVALLKISSSGLLTWNRSFRSDNNFINPAGKSLSVYDQNILKIFWSEQNLTTGIHKPRISYYNSSGQNIQEIQLSEELQNSGGAIKIINDGNGNSYAGMNVFNSVTGLSKPEIRNVSQGWYSVIEGTANTSGSFIDMGADNQNNLVVLAMVINNNTSQDFRTVKYSPGGNIMWQKEFNGSQNGDDYPFAVTADRDNNIYVTGLSRSGAVGTEDVVTIKYDPNGNIKWTRLFNGPANGTDQGITICVDNEKNVYVAGATDLGGIKLGFLTIKYDSLGNQVWTKTYNFSTTSPEDFVYSIAVNPARDVYVTGISFSNTSDYDFATIKYSQPIGIQNISGEVPNSSLLSQNYPNPFNPGTSIRFSISKLKFVKLSVFNILGQEIEILFNNQLNAGIYEVNWDGSRFPSGIYYYNLKAGENFSETKKMVLVK